MKKNKYFRSDKSFSSFDNIQPQNAEFINQLDSIVLHRTLLIVEKQAGTINTSLFFNSQNSSAICSRAWTNSLSREHHPCVGQSKVSNVSDNMNYVSDNMNYLTTHGILHHVLENQSFITSHLCLCWPINFMVFRSKEHHVSQHMVRVLCSVNQRTAEKVNKNILTRPNSSNYLKANYFQQNKFFYFISNNVEVYEELVRSDKDNPLTVHSNSRPVRKIVLFDNLYFL